MTTTMKGVLKGLRYISEIFDADSEKEPEMQIGQPTDVKHVAHIGYDGPSTTPPTWMNEFPAGSEPSAGSPNVDVGKDSPTHRGKTKQSRRAAANSSTGSAVKDLLAKPRRNKDTGDESPKKEASRARRIKNSILGSDSPTQQTGTKKIRKKKGDGATKTSRTKNKDSSTADNMACSETGCSYAPQEHEEGGTSDDISRRMQAL